MSAGFSKVPEDRHAPYVHDQHRPGHGVFACCRRSRRVKLTVSPGSQARLHTRVAAVAAVASYEHTYDLMRAHGEAGWSAHMIPLTVDGPIYASSMVMLDSARRKTPVPALARCLLGLGIATTRD